jgi:hypothetical protein
LIILDINLYSVHNSTSTYRYTGTVFNVLYYVRKPRKETGIVLYFLGGVETGTKSLVIAQCSLYIAFDINLILINSHMRVQPFRAHAFIQ